MNTFCFPLFLFILIYFYLFLVDPKRFERLRRVSKTPMLPLHQGSIKMAAHGGNAPSSHG
jgi:hypothetical protein